MDLIEILKDSEEYDVFQKEAMVDLIQYKWDTTGFNFHIVSFINHYTYMSLLFIYIGYVYILDSLYTTKEIEGEIVRV